MTQECLISYGNRKIFGLKTSNVVTLPIALCRRLEIEKGDQVEIFLSSDNEILISPIYEGQKDERKACAALG